MFPRKSDYRLSPSKMFLIKVPEDVETLKTSEETHYIGGTTQSKNGERDNHLETEITAGQYLLYS